MVLNYAYELTEHIHAADMGRVLRRQRRRLHLRGLRNAGSCTNSAVAGLHLLDEPEGPPRWRPRYHRCGINAAPAPARMARIVATFGCTTFDRVIIDPGEIVEHFLKATAESRCTASAGLTTWTHPVIERVPQPTRHGGPERRFHPRPRDDREALGFCCSFSPRAGSGTRPAWRHHDRLLRCGGINASKGGSSPLT